MPRSLRTSSTRSTMYPVLFDRWLLPLIRRTSNFTPSYLSFCCLDTSEYSLPVLAHCGHSAGGVVPFKIKPHTLHFQVAPGSVLPCFTSAGAIVDMLVPLPVLDRASRTETTRFFIYTCAFTGLDQAKRDLFLTIPVTWAHPAYA